MNRIREIRQLNGITQTDLAKFLGIAQSTLSFWENGRYEPDFTSIKKLADRFHTSIDYILGYGYDAQIFSKRKPDLLELMQLYERLSFEDQKTLLAVAKGLARDK